MPDISQFFPITAPTLIFFVVLCIILFAPIIMGKLRIPHIVGMVLAGVIVGPHGFNILAKDSSFDLFGHVGLYYIMFLAGLEMNMSNFRKTGCGRSPTASWPSLYLWPWALCSTRPC